MTTYTRPVLLLLCGLLLLTLAIAVLNTLVPLWLAHENLPTWQVGMVSSSFFTGNLLGTLLTGSLIKRFGFNRSYYLASLIFAAGCAGLGLMVGFWSWVAWRFIAGVGCAMIWVVVESALMCSGTSRNRGRLLAAYMMVYYVGTVLGQLMVSKLPTDLMSVLPWVTGMVLAAILPLLFTRIARAAAISRIMRAISPLVIIVIGHSPSKNRGALLNGCDRRCGHVDGDAALGLDHTERAGGEVANTGGSAVDGTHDLQVGAFLLSGLKRAVEPRVAVQSRRGRARYGNTGDAKGEEHGHQHKGDLDNTGEHRADSLVCLSARTTDHVEARALQALGASGGKSLLAHIGIGRHIIGDCCVCVVISHDMRPRSLAIVMVRLKLRRGPAQSLSPCGYSLIATRILADRARGLRSTS